MKNAFNRKKRSEIVFTIDDEISPVELLAFKHLLLYVCLFTLFTVDYNSSNIHELKSTQFTF